MATRTLPFAPHWFAVLCGPPLFEPQSSDLGAFSQILAGVADQPFRWRPRTKKTSTRPDSVAGLRGLEPADVISTMFIAAHGRKVSGPTMFVETKKIRPVFQWLTENDVCEFESLYGTGVVKRNL